MMDSGRLVVMARPRLDRSMASLKRSCKLAPTGSSRCTQVNCWNNCGRRPINSRYRQLCFQVVGGPFPVLFQTPREQGTGSFLSCYDKNHHHTRTTGGVRWRGTRKLCLATKMALVIGKCVSSLKEDYVADSPSIPSCDSTFPLLSKSFRYIVLFSQISNKAQQQTSSRTTVITSRKHEVLDHLLRSVHHGDHAHE
jgi:hypothetical protein